MSDEIRLIVRGDDMGMTYSNLVAVEKCFEEGILTCAAIIAAAPWAEAAAKLAVEHRNWCIGVHLATIGEWRGYRWRPVLPYDRVPSLVDEDGFLPQSPKQFYALNPDYGELEEEFRAQVRLVKKWGVELGYIDMHYIGGESDPNYLDVVKRIAAEEGLPISGHAGERFMRGIYADPAWLKERVLAQQLEELTPGLWLLVDHLLVDSPESQALVHTEPADVMRGGVGNLRVAETQCLLSPRIKEIIARRGIKLTDYRALKPR
ncbi:MAG: ChbG/HpnK family deacetylase [Candidatus Bathyarchaeia archaeon]